MNLIFHVAAAVALAALAALILHLQKQRDLLAILMRQAAFGGPASIRLESPDRFLQRFASALDISYEDDLPSKLPVARIQTDVFGKVFVQQGIHGIQCSHENGQNRVHFKLTKATPEVQNQLSEALGGALTVTTEGVGV